jgi:RNA polymerase sigma-70 factor (ECF subfamily)
MSSLQEQADLRSDGAEATAEEVELIAALRRGEEAAFAKLLGQYHGALVRLAMVYVGDRAIAEEVAQETWLGVLRGLERFEGRSSLKTWIFRILTNRAKTRGEREGRTIAFSALASGELESDDPAVEPERFLPADHPRWPGHWASAPRPWSGDPEARLLSNETGTYIRQAVDRLPSSQRAVIILRDVQGFESEEVCELLGLTATNQRVLLHRARSKVRGALEQYMSEQGGAG